MYAHLRVRTLSLLPTILLAGCLLGDERSRYQAQLATIEAQPPLADPAPLGSAGWSPGSLTFEELAAQGRFDPARALELARRANPELRAALARWRAALERAPQEAAWDDPMLGAAYFAEPIQTRAGPQRWRASLSQELPFPGKRGARVDAALAAALVEEGRYRGRVLTLEEDVLDAWADLYRAERMLEVTTAEIAIVDQIEEAARQAFGAGGAEAGAANAARARLRRSLLERRRVRHQRMLEVARAAMNELLARPPLAPLPPTDLHPALPPLPEVMAEQELVQLAVEERPEVAAALAAIQRGESLQQAARLEYFPNLRLGVEWFGIGESSVRFRNAEEDAFAVTFGLEIPIFVERRAARVREVEAETRRAEAELAALRDEIGRQVVSALARVREADAAIEIYEAARIQAESALASTRAAFQALRGDITAVLEAEEDLEETLHGWHEAVGEAIEARAELWRALGRPAPYSPR